MKRTATIALSALVFLVGLGIMFYPTISNWLHEQTASYAISDYLDQVTAKSDAQYADEFAAARAYNASLSGDVRSFLEAETAVESDYENPEYYDTFDQVNGIMGIITVPSVNISLPIYHGTDEAVLQKGAGHLEGSALPTGDVGNHTVITGHTGLPTAMLFTDLDELVLGDHFYLDILNQVFAYEVVNIYVVLPSETDNLVAQSDKDLVTLVTCTPYGVNSHRLLIQGQRIENDLEADTLVTTNESVIDTGSDPLESLPMLTVVALCLGAVFLLAIVVLFVGNRYTPRRLSKGSEPQENQENQEPPEPLENPEPPESS